MRSAPMNSSSSTHAAYEHLNALRILMRHAQPDAGVVRSLLLGFWSELQHTIPPRDVGADTHEPASGLDGASAAVARSYLEALESDIESASNAPPPSILAHDFLCGDLNYRGGDAESAWMTKQLRSHLKVCTRALAEDPRRGALPLAAARHVQRERLTRISAFVVAVAGFSYGAYDVLRPHIIGDGLWRGAYYSQPKFMGEPDIIRDRDINFEWKQRSPSPEIPNDKISIRWDTCIELDEDQDVAFQLIADDGARLFIDDEVAIDVWKTKRSKRRTGVHVAVKGAELQLKRGRHHVRVEYRENVGLANVQLLASMGLVNPPSPIPAALLRYPGDDMDIDDPCGLH